MQVPHHTPHHFFSDSWQTTAALNLSALERSWLEDAGSLTARLCTLGEFRVELLHERQISLPDDDATFLQLPRLSACLLREVILRSDNIPVVFATSLLPLASLAGDNQVLGHMRERSLGSELFRNPCATRQQLQACCMPASQLPNACELDGSTPKLLARRSLFIKQRQPLMVGECFLPSLWRRLGASRPAKAEHK